MQLHEAKEAVQACNYQDRHTTAVPFVHSLRTIASRMQYGGADSFEDIERWEAGWLWGRGGSVHCQPGTYAILYVTQSQGKQRLTRHWWQTQDKTAKRTLTTSLAVR